MRRPEASFRYHRWSPRAVVVWAGALVILGVAGVASASVLLAPSIPGARAPVLNATTTVPTPSVTAVPPHSGGGLTLLAPTNTATPSGGDDAAAEQESQFSSSGSMAITGDAPASAGEGAPASGDN